MNSFDNVRSYLQTIVIDRALSVGRGGGGGSLTEVYIPKWHVAGSGSVACDGGCDGGVSDEAAEDGTLRHWRVSDFAAPPTTAL